MTNKKYRKNVLSLTKKLLGEADNRDAEYDKFFRAALDKFGVNSPDELPDDKKDDFFDYVDKNWKSDAEDGNVDEAVVDADKKDDPKIVDPSQQDIEKVDEEKALRAMIRQELASIVNKKKD